MKSSTKKMNNYFKKEPMGIVYLMGFLGCISLMFVYVCLMKVYEEAYTTRLSCNRSICYIEKETIIGEKTTQKYLTYAELSLVKLEKLKNFFLQNKYYLVLEDPSTDFKYFLTNETGNTDEQNEYILQISQFMNGEREILILENPRYKIKFIGLSLAAAGALVAATFFMDCVNGIIKMRKEQKKARSYQSILGSGRY